jgi:hypothetical protein
MMLVPMFVAGLIVWGVAQGRASRVEVWAGRAERFRAHPIRIQVVGDIVAVARLVRELPESVKTRWSTWREIRRFRREI